MVAPDPPSEPPSPGAPHSDAPPTRETLPAFAPAVLRRIPWILAPWLGVLLVAATLMHLRDRERDRSLGLERASGVVDLHAEIVERELEWAAFAILDLSQGRSIVGQLSGGDRRTEVEEEFARFCSVSGVFDQVRLLDDEGTEIVRVDYEDGAAVVVPQELLQMKSDRYYVQRARELPRGGVYVSPFDLNVEHGAVETPWNPVVRIATPCFDEAGRSRGLIVLNYLGAALLRQLGSAAEPAGGWHALVNDDGYFLEAPGDERSWGFLFDEPPTFARSRPQAWERMAGASEGNFDALDTTICFRRLVPHEERVRSGDRYDLDLRTLIAIPHDELYAGSRETLGRMAWVGAAVLVLLAVTAWRLAYVGAQRRVDENRIAESERRLRVLSTRLLEVQEAERRRLSRDLHDDIGQLATAMTIDLGRARRLDEERAKDEAIDRARDGASQLLESVRRVAASLRSSSLEDLGFAGAVREHLREVEERTGLVATLELDVDDAAIPATTSTHLFRVVQEAVSNALRHAGVEAIRVALRCEAGRAVLVVEDGGEGFDLESAHEGVGLLGMRERIELLGGRFDVRSTRGQGTRIEASVPLGRDDFGGTKDSYS